MAALVLLTLVICGATVAKGGHTSVDCCMNELCPYDCVRCDGKPTCYDLSDELGCDNKTDSVLRSYPKPPIFIPAVMDMLKDHLLKQKKQMAHVLTHRTCFRKPDYRQVGARQRNMPTTTQWPSWLKLLEQLKNPNAPTTTQAPPVWLKLLMKLKSEASTTTTTTTTPKPTTTTELSIVDILFEWMRLKQERDSQTPAPREDNDYTQYKIPKSPSKATVKPETVMKVTQAPTVSSNIVFTSPDMTAIYSKLNSTTNIPLPTKAPTAINTEPQRPRRPPSALPLPTDGSLNTVKIQSEPSHDHHKKPLPHSPIDDIYSDPNLSYWPVYVDPKQRDNLITTVTPLTTTIAASATQTFSTETTTASSTPSEKAAQTSTNIGFDETTTEAHAHAESLQTTTGFNVDETTTTSISQTESLQTTMGFGVDGASTTAQTHETSAYGLSEQNITTTELSVQTSTLFTIPSTQSVIVTHETESLAYNGTQEIVNLSSIPTVKISATSNDSNHIAQTNESSSVIVTQASKQLTVTDIPTSTDVFYDSKLKQKVISTTGIYEPPTTDITSDMFSVQTSVQADNNTAVEIKEDQNNTKSTFPESQITNDSSLLNTALSASLPVSTIDNSNSSSFSHTVPQVTTNEQTYAVVDDRKTMKVFVNFSDIVSDIVASTPSLKAPNKPNISPTSASKTITSLFPDPTRASRIAQTVYNNQPGLQQNIRTPEPRSRSVGVMPVETKLFGRLSVNEKEPNKVASHNIANVQVNRQDFLENSNIQSRPVQRFVGPIFPSAEPVPARIPTAPVQTQPPTQPGVGYQFLPTTAPTPSWWQTTNSPFGMIDLWGRTTAFPDTTGSWWSQTTSNSFWNSLFGYVPTTQRNFIQPQQRLVPFVRPATAMPSTFQTTSRPLAPPTVTQTPLYQIPPTITPQMATIKQYVTDEQQQQTTPSPISVAIQSTTGKVVPTTDIKIPNDLTDSTAIQSSTVDITFPNDMTQTTSLPSPIVDVAVLNDSTPSTAVPTPSEASSQSGVTFPSVTFSTSHSYESHNNHTSVGTPDNRIEMTNVTVPWNEQSLNTSSISILRNLYLDILEAQRAIEGQAGNMTQDHYFHSDVNGTFEGDNKVTFNTTAWTTGIGKVTQKVINPEFRTTQAYVKPIITTQSTVDKTEFTWWNARSGSTPLVGRSSNSRVSQTMNTSTRLEPETGTALFNDTSYDVTHTQSIEPSSSVAVNTNIPNSSPGFGSTNIPMNSSPGMRMSNVLGVTIPDVYPTDNSVQNFRFELTNTPSNNDFIRPTPSNINVKTGTYDIQKPVLAEWSGRQNEILYKSKSPTRESWWDKIMTVVTETSDRKIDQRHGPRDTQTVTYNLFQTTTTRSTGTPRDRTFNGRATNSGVTEKPLLYYDVTAPSEGSHTRSRECRLVHDAGEFCSTKQPGYYKNPENCRTFYVCEWRKQFVCPCPPGTVFDDTLNVCNWEYEVKCTTSHSFK